MKAALEEVEEPGKYVYYKRHDYEGAKEKAEEKMVHLQDVKCAPWDLGAIDGLHLGLPSAYATPSPSPCHE